MLIRKMNVSELGEWLGVTPLDTFEEMNMDWVSEVGAQAMESARGEFIEDWKDSYEYEYKDEEEFDALAVEAADKAEAKGKFDKARDDAENEIMRELWRNYVGAVESAANHIFEPHGIDASEVGEGGMFDITTDDPTEAAVAIRETINGGGMVWVGGNMDEFREIEDAAEDGSEDLEIVKDHLESTRRYPAVYGGMDVQSVFSGALS